MTTDVVPDVVSTVPLRAFRAWRVGLDGQLIPMFWVHSGPTPVWQGAQAAAWCSWSNDHSAPHLVHDLPDADTAGWYAMIGLPPAEPACGLYADRTLANLFARFPIWMHSRDVVYGAVSCSGTVVVGEKGVRAARMKVESLLCLHRRLTPVGLLDRWLLGYDTDAPANHTLAVATAKRLGVPLLCTSSLRRMDRRFPAGRY